MVVIGVSRAGGEVSRVLADAEEVAEMVGRRIVVTLVSVGAVTEVVAEGLTIEASVGVAGGE